MTPLDLVAPRVPQLVPLHGLGGRQDLPLPFTLVLVGAAAALVATFVVVAVLRPGTGTRAAVVPLPQLTRLVDAAATRVAVRLVGIVVTVFMAVALVAGPNQLTNPIFGYIYVWVWVGLVPVSLLFGRVWPALNAFRTAGWVLCRLTRVDPAHRLFDLPKWVARWPAVIGLAAFVWLELVAPDRATRPVLKRPRFDAAPV